MLFQWIGVKVEIQTHFLSVRSSFPPQVYGMTSVLGAVDPA